MPYSEVSTYSDVSVVGKWWLGVAVLFILCSFLSKEQGITVVAVCVVYDAFCIQKVSTNSILH